MKWLRRLELLGPSLHDARGDVKVHGADSGRQSARFSLSRWTLDPSLLRPTYPARLERGWQEIRGLAWTGRGRITRVDVSVDGGKNWSPAELAGPVLPKAHTRFRFPWKWTGGGAELVSRAVDETGYVQPTQRQLIDTRGRGSLPYHLNSMITWLVEADGRILYKAEPWA